MKNFSAEANANKSTNAKLETTVAVQQQEDDYQPASVAYNQTLSTNRSPESLTRKRGASMRSVEFKSDNFWRSWPRTARLILVKPTFFFTHLPQNRRIQPAILFFFIGQALANGLLGYFLTVLRYIFQRYFLGFANPGIGNISSPSNWLSLFTRFLFPSFSTSQPYYIGNDPTNASFGRLSVFFLNYPILDLPYPYPILLFPLTQKKFPGFQGGRIQALSLPLLYNFFFPFALMFAFAWFYYWWSRRLGGQGTYRNTLKGYFYAAFPLTIFATLPYLGWLGLIFSVYPLVSMLKRTHKLSSFSALVVLVLSLLSTFFFLDSLLMGYIYIFR